jgi:arylsulfatase A-like enzyme
MIRRRDFLSLTACSALAAGCRTSTSARAVRRDKPNVLVILADDLGYGDLSCYGAADIRTPHIDALMKAGKRFTRFRSNCCVCAPTRAALLTGRYPEFVGVPGVIRTFDKQNWGTLLPGCLMLPELFRANGWTTSLVGKWHLGLEEGSLPNERGFARFRGFLGDMMDDYWTHLRHGVNYMRKDRETIAPEGHATDLFTRWAQAEIVRADEMDEPLFLYLAYNAPHAPIQPPEEWLARAKKRLGNTASEQRVRMAAFVEHLDAGVGCVLQTLKERGLERDTLVVFSSDNGGDLRYGSSNGAWRSGKTHMYEGGVTVPASFTWEGTIAPGLVEQDMATMDVLPTVMDLLGLKIPAGLDGQSFAQVLADGMPVAAERPVFHMWREGFTTEALRYGDWKLVRDRDNLPWELYNLRDDPGETKDLASVNPDKLHELRRVMDAHMARAYAVPWTRPVQPR